MNHGRLRIHKTHHGSNSREATTFPHIVYSALLHGALIQMAFCLGSPEIAKVGIPTTLQDYNFLCGPPIKMRFKAKL
jgi:hypothetical protein